MYSPTLGRFLQSDPVQYDDDFNLYAYVGNDPLNAVDPTGTTGTMGCTGSRLGSGCEFVSGSLARNEVLRDRSKDNGVAVSNVTSDDQILLAGPPGDQTTIQLKLRDYIIRGDFRGLKQYVQTLDEAGMELTPQLRAMVDRAIYRSELVGSKVQHEAAKNGFTRIVKDPPFKSHGQTVFTYGQRFLTKDADSHSGGVWKLFDSAEKCGRLSTSS